MRARRITSEWTPRHPTPPSLYRVARPSPLAPDPTRARLELPEARPSSWRATGAPFVLVSILVVFALVRSLGTSDLAHELAARMIEHVVASETGATLAIGHVDRLDDAHAWLRDVRLADAEGHTLLAVDSVSADYDARSLLLGRLAIARAVAKGGAIEIASDPVAQASDDVVRIAMLDTVDVVRRGGDGASEPIALRVAADGTTRITIASIGARRAGE